jgi:hypothetical protein
MMITFPAVQVALVRSFAPGAFALLQREHAPTSPISDTPSGVVQSKPGSCALRRLVLVLLVGL